MKQQPFYNFLDFLQRILLRLDKHVEKWAKFHLRQWSVPFTAQVFAQLTLAVQLFTSSKKSCTCARFYVCPCCRRFSRWCSFTAWQRAVCLSVHRVVQLDTHAVLYTLWTRKVNRSDRQKGRDTHTHARARALFFLNTVFFREIFEHQFYLEAIFVDLIVEQIRSS